MKVLIFTCFLFSCLTSFSQEKNDHKVIVTMPDTNGLYLKTKTAIANSSFIVKDNNNLDTLTTQTKPLDFIPGYMIIKAIISGNTVTFSGIYGLNRLSIWGYTEIPKSYSRVVYYKGSRTWRILVDAAIKMQGELTFSK